MTFLEKWAVWANAFLEALFWPFLVAIVLLCLGERTAIKILAGSVVFGALCGAAAAHLGWGDTAKIGLAIAGTLTAPVTITKLMKLDLLEVIDRFRAAKPRE